MTIFPAPTRLIDDIAENYAKSRTNKQQPVYMSDAVLAFRKMIPRCAWSDAQLTNLLASKIIKHGIAIYFDGERRQKAPSSNIDVLKSLPSLRARAYSVIRQRELADDVVERALKLAIARVGTLPKDEDIGIWLLHLIDEAAGLPSVERPVTFH